MAIIAIDKTLDVITKYNSLVSESLDTDSVYIRTKETLVEFFNSGAFTGQEKARIIAEVLSNLNSSLVNASITTALEWAKAEKMFEFEKEELGYKVDVIDQQAEVEAAKVKQLMADVMATTATSRRQNGAATVDPTTGFTTALEWAKAEKMFEFEKEELGYKVDVIDQQAEVEAAKVKQLMADVMATTATSMRQNGAATVNPGTGFTTGLANDGKVWKEMVLMEQELLNKQAEKDVLVSRLKESQAAVYKIVADTAANFGSGTYTISDSGVTSSGFNSTDSLSYYQKEIAKEQAKGYTYNAWANAVNASATAVSMLLSTEMAGLETDAGEITGYLKTGLNNLVTASANLPAVP